MPRNLNAALGAALVCLPLAWAQQSAAHDLTTRKLCLETVIAAAPAAGETFESRSAAVRHAREAWEANALAEVGVVFSAWDHSEDQRSLCGEVPALAGAAAGHQCEVSASPCRSEWFAVDDGAGTLRVYSAETAGHGGVEMDGTARLPEVPPTLASADACPDLSHAGHAHRHAHDAGHAHAADHVDLAFYRDDENYLVLCGTEQQLGLVEVGERDRLGSNIPYPARAFRLEPGGTPIGGVYAATDVDHAAGGHAFGSRPVVAIE